MNPQENLNGHMKKKDSGLKLFIWKDPFEYNDGIIIAYANNINEARELVKKETCNGYLGKRKEKFWKASEEYKALSYDPKIYEIPKVFIFRGHEKW